MALTGYAHPLNAVAGGSVEFKLHDDEAGQAELQLVRLIHGDENPAGPGFVEVEVASNLPQSTAIGPQRTTKGSYARLQDGGPLFDGALPSATIFAFIRPGIVGGARQAILGAWDPSKGQGFSLGISAEGCVELRLGSDSAELTVACTKKLAANCWYFVAAGWDAEHRKVTLFQKSRINSWNSQLGPVSGFDLDEALTLACTGVPRVEAGPFALAATIDAEGLASELYNGKIDRHGIVGALLDGAALDRLADGALPDAAQTIAYWDTTKGYTDRGIGDLIHDVGPNALHLVGVNRPIRALTGWNWSGRNDCFRLAPGEYGGIAFHEDALIDCQWRTNVSLGLPEDLRSGVYALRIRKDGREDHVPFFVRPRVARSKLAVLMPTFTYLAYANEHLSFEAPIAQAICANTPVVTADDLDWKAEELYGLSTYDVHSDYSGVCYSSWLRPIQNLRPRYRMPAAGVPWAFPADLSLIWWLENQGFDYDVITDHDLDDGGLELLSGYRAVATGTHPEYFSLTMLDALERFAAEGGRIAYLGGNGLYWVTETRPSEPWCIEVRKLDTGSRAWQAAPGEGYLATTGDRSGLWRARGRPPQKIVALGFTTEGMDESRPFERMPDSFSPAAAWMFEGIGADEPIGDFGLGLGGAAGLELDRYDLALGTPPHTMLLASSFDHSDNYPLVSEEITYAFPGRGGTQDPQVRGDIAYFTTAGGGAVFAAGSIAFSQALPVAGGRNNVSTLLKNVLDAFLNLDELPQSA